LFGNANVLGCGLFGFLYAIRSARFLGDLAGAEDLHPKPKAACADAVNMAEVYGAAPFDKGHPCQPIPGTEDDAGNGDYSLQTGPDVAQYITIYYQNAPRQTPLTEVDGVPMEVNGPYRNLTDPADIGSGDDFDLNSGMPDGDGGFLIQKKWILQVNRNAHNGVVHSDLAGFEWHCDKSDSSIICTEPLVLPDPEDPASTYPQVHHVVPRRDLRCCPWGTNSYKNAAVISAKLNQFLSNNNPPADEVKQLNNATPYPP
jgi:hypothetical protein